MYPYLQIRERFHVDFPVFTNTVKFANTGLTNGGPRPKVGEEKQDEPPFIIASIIFMCVSTVLSKRDHFEKENPILKLLPVL